MSYILEALKKSSEERARLTPVEPRPESAPASARAPGRVSPASWRWIAAVGLVALLVIMVEIGKGRQESGSSPDRVQQADKSVPSVAPPVVPPAEAMASPAAVAVEPSKQASAAVTTPAAVPPAVSPAPSVAAAPKPLPEPAVQAPIPAPKPKREPVPAPPVAKMPIPKPAPAAMPAPAPAQSAGADMPPEMMRQVLAIPISAHLYSSKPADRMVIIDGRGVREGDVLPSGMTVEQITPSGITVTYKGYRANRPVH